jgi:hypothetical protein
MAQRHQRARPHRRYGYWYLVRRVPRAFSAYDTRNPVMLSASGVAPCPPLMPEALQAAVELLHSGTGHERARVVGDPDARDVAHRRG